MFSATSSRGRNGGRTRKLSESNPRVWEESEIDAILSIGSYTKKKHFLSAVERVVAAIQL